jgi:DNA-binding CsgD family transcriptional regulator/tetratricopeptide (TPR) repeat protein
MADGPDSGLPRKVFVARERELSVLRAAWESAYRGDGRVVAIEGEPGIGKSALAEAFFAEVTRPVIRVRATDGDPPVPWGVLADIFASLPGVSAADRTMARSPQALPTAVRETLTGYLRSGGTLAIFLDDAQWADEQSLTVLLDVGRRMRSEPVLLVAAYQANDRSPFPAPAGPSLARAWRQMLDGDRATALKLDGLPPEDILRLAVASGCHGLSPGDAARLHQETGGNPDYLLDLFPLLSTKPIVIGESPLPVPANRAAGIAARFAACGPQTRRLLSAAAVLGQRFSVATLRDVSGIPEPWPYIHEATENALLEMVPGSDRRELRFPRRVTGEAIYWAIGERERVGWHRRCALFGGPEVLRHRIAAIDGMDDALAADLRRAGEARMRAHDLTGAAYYLQRAMDCTARGPARTALLLRAVEALLIVGKLSAVMEYLGELEQAPADPWRDYVLGYLLMLAGEADQGTRLLRGALDALDRGEPVPTGAPGDLRARIAAQLGVLGVILLSYQQTLADGSAAVAANSPDTAVRGLAWVAKTLGMALAGEGAVALTLLADAGEPGSDSGLEGLAIRGIIRLWTDDIDGAARDLHEVFRRCVRGEALRTSQAIGYLGEAEYRKGRLREAVHFAGLAVDNARDNDRYWDYPVLHALAAYPYAAQGDWDRAHYHAAESEAMARLIGAPAFLAYAAGARAAIAQARGDAAELLSAAEVLEAAYDSREPGTHLFGPVRAEALARLGRWEEAAKSLQRFRDGPASGGRKSAQMIIARVAAEIAIARGDYVQACRESERGHALSVEIGLPLETARICLTAARAFHLRGHRAVAERALQSGYHGFAAMGAIAYVRQAESRAAEWDMRLDDVLAVLTARERQICVLAAKGMTSTQIARKLSIDLKTVESHRTSAYRKLGLRTLAELKRLLGHA